MALSCAKGGGGAASLPTPPPRIGSLSDGTRYASPSPTWERHLASMVTGASDNSQSGPHSTPAHIHLAGDV